MAANLELIALAILALFSVFAGGIAYAEWATRGMDVYRAKKG